MAEAQAAPTVVPDPLPDHRPRRRKVLLIALALACVAAALIYVVFFVLLAPPREETDDAYVAGDVVAVTALDPGSVTAIQADNTEIVRAGQPLVELDPASADVALQAAEADLARAVRGFYAVTSQVSGGDAAVRQAETELAKARNDFARRQSAAAQGAISGEELSHAGDAVKLAEANLASARAQRQTAASSIQGTSMATSPVVLAAMARYRQAAITRSHMHIVAPVDGVIAQRTAQVGQQVAAGAPLMAVVPISHAWVDANFRETQLRDLRIGQPAEVTADAYGKDVKFHGRVVGISAGSGNAFALLPPQNASGNWIKIVQRVPVRIALDPAELARRPLRIGLSVKVTVDTGDTNGSQLGLPGKPLAARVAPGGGDPAVERRIAAIVAANRGRGQ